MTTPTAGAWTILAYRDAPAAIAFLTDVLGFVPAATYTRDGDPSVVEHAELRWPAGGGVMLGSAGKDDSLFGRRQPGGAVYLVCDDPDAVHARVVAAGVEVARPLSDEDYGSRGFTCIDAEGVLWDLGTYAGAPLPDGPTA